MAAARRCCGLAALALLGAEGLRTSGPTATGIKRQGDAGHRHVIAMKEQKLAFCFFQKVASEHFGPLFNSVNNISNGGFDPEYSSLLSLGIPWSEVTRDNGWRFALFVRDPLERYLSAFLAKCVPTGSNKGPSSGGIFCHGPTRSAPVSKEEKIALFEERARSDAVKGLADDDHWMSQYTIVKKHCGTDKFEPSTVDYVGHMTHDQAETNDQVQGMLKLTSLSGIADLAKEHFPLPKPLALIECPNQHCTRSHKDFQDYYRNPEIVSIVAKLFQDDYEKFSLPLPTADASQHD